MSAQDLYFTVSISGVSGDPEGATEIPEVSLDGLATPAMSDLTSSQYLLVTATNAGDEALAGVGLWFDVATFPADESVTPNNSPHSDLVDLIKIGDDAIDAGGPLTVETSDDLTGLDTSGLWVLPNAGSGGTTWYRVCSLRGVSKPARIGAMATASLSSATWALVMDGPGTGANRFYFDINVDVAES